MCVHKYPVIWVNFSIITGRNEVLAKVMFLQVCVCPQGGGGEGVCLSACWDAIPPPGLGRPPPDLADPPRSHTTTPQIRHHHPPPGSDTTTTTTPDQTPPPPPPRTWQTPPPPPPPGSRLQHTVYERPVRILLECILVHDFASDQNQHGYKN